MVCKFESASKSDGLTLLERLEPTAALDIGCWATARKYAKIEETRENRQLPNTKPFAEGAVSAAR